MSDPVTATGGARFAGSDCAISDLGALGMVAIRGEAGDPAFAAAVQAETGFALPPVRRFEGEAEAGLCWMSPDEWLLTCPYAEAEARAGRLRAAFGGLHALAVNVSDARAAFRIEGEGARALLARGAPVDLAPAAFGEGDVRRTRLGQVAAAFWLGRDGAFRLVCFRSVGAYVFDWLKASAASGARPAGF